MKKLLFILSVCILLISCGKKNYELYTRADKVGLSEKMIAIEKKIITDEKLLDEMKSLFEELRKATRNGDPEAKVELEEWQDILETERMFWRDSKAKKFDPNYNEEDEEPTNGLMSKDGKVLYRLK